MELIPPLGDGKVIDSSPASVHKDPNSECLRPEIPGLEKLRNGVSMQENIVYDQFSKEEENSLMYCAFEGFTPSNPTVVET